MLFEELQFARYRIVHLIGQRGASIVYLADDQHIPRQVALQIIQNNVKVWTA